MSPTHKTRIRLTHAGRCWLLTIALIMLVALVKNINLLMLIGYFLAALFAINWWSVSRGLRKTRISVVFPSTSTIGDNLPVSLTIERMGAGRLHRVIATAKIGDGESRAVFAECRPSVPETRRCNVPARRRAVVPQASVSLTHSFPFGLIESRAVILADAPIWIYPAMQRMDLERFLRRMHVRFYGRGQRRQTVRHLTEGTDVHGLRPFRAGDSPRWIHWRTTARVGRPMVREFDRAAGAGLLVIADLEATPSAHAEAALSLLASLVRAWGQSQDGRLTIALSTDEKWHRVELSHRRQTTDVLKALAEWPDCKSGEPQMWSQSGIEAAAERLPILVVGKDRIGLGSRPNTVTISPQSLSLPFVEAAHA